MRIKAFAKINFGLNITGIRQDGYHLLKSIFIEIPFYDILEIERTKDITELNIIGADLSCGEDNLCMRAARMMIEKYGLEGGVSMKLTKNIPMQAGLGGGSSDAAAVIKGICSLFSLELSEKEKIETAAALGADVPFFLSGGCALASGIGEKLSALPMAEGLFLLLAKPEKGADTGRVYRLWDAGEKHFSEDVSAAAAFLQKKDVLSAFKYAVNTLEEPAFRLVPEIKRIKSLLLENGALYASMTGSGSCVYGLFNDEESCKRAYDSVDFADFRKLLKL